MGHTVEKLPMVIREAEPDAVPRISGAPVLMKAGDVPKDTPLHHVLGEIFLVDRDVVQALDLIEGVKSGRYYKDRVYVKLAHRRLDGGSDQLPCMAYFRQTSDELQIYARQYGTHSEFTPRHNENYLPKDLDERIVALMRGIALNRNAENQALEPS